MHNIMFISFINFSRAENTGTSTRARPEGSVTRVTSLVFGDLYSSKLTNYHLDRLQVKKYYDFSSFKKKKKLKN